MTPRDRGCTGKRIDAAQKGGTARGLWVVALPQWESAPGRRERCYVEVPRRRPRAHTGTATHHRLSHSRFQPARHSPHDRLRWSRSTLCAAALRSQVDSVPSFCGRADADYLFFGSAVIALRDSPCFSPNCSRKRNWLKPAKIAILPPQTPTPHAVREHSGATPWWTSAWDSEEQKGPPLARRRPGEFSPPRLFSGK